MKANIALLLLLILALPALAQEPQVYDLQAVLQRTLQANPDIRASAQDVALAQTQVDEAKAHGRPTVRAEAGYLQLADDPSFSVVGMGTMVFGTADNPFANVSLQWPIYTGGRIQQMLAAAREGVDASLQGHERARQEVLAEAAVAYYQALSAQRMIAVMDAQIATLQEAVRIATALNAQGMVAKLDVLRPQADLAAAQAARIQAQQGAAVALTNLKRIMNLPRETTITLAPGDPLPAPATELEGAVAQALAARPEVKQLEAYARAAAAQQQAARAERRPTVGLQVQVDAERPTTHPNYGDWSAAVVLQQPLYDGGVSKAREARAAAQRAQLAAKEEALRQGITTQVTNALLSLQAAEARVTASEAALTTAEEAYRFAEVSYKNQVVPIVDVLAAQTALTHARTQLALARFDRDAAAVHLHLALGQTPLAQ